MSGGQQAGAPHRREVAAALRRVRRAAVVAAVPLVVAVVSAAAGHSSRAAWWGGGAFVAAVLVMAGVPLDRLAQRVGRWASSAVAAVFAVVAGLVVGSVGLVAMMVGASPLGDESPRSDESAWAPADSRPVPEARRLFAGGGRRGWSWRRVARLVGAALIVVGAVAVGTPAARAVKGVFVEEDRSGPPIEFPSWAYPDASWVGDLHRAGWPVGYHPALGWQARDITSTYLNVRSGVRRSWSAGASSGGDRPPVVWFLGGSTLYGLGQRDDRTIPSEVARRAAAAGRPIRAVNLGVPGYDQWQEVALMSFRLSRGERPDVVVFYDGANDMQSMAYRAEQGIRPLDEPPNRFHEAIEQQTRYHPEPRGTAASENELRSAFVEMFGAGLDLARRTGAAYGVDVVAFWQPTAWTTRRTPADGPFLRAFPGPTDEGTVGTRERNEAVLAALGDACVDLTHALDGARTPVFIDEVHTNELGASMIADAMWPAIDRAIAEQGAR